MALRKDGLDKKLISMIKTNIDHIIMLNKTQIVIFIYGFNMVDSSLFEYYEV